MRVPIAPRLGAALLGAVAAAVPAAAQQPPPAASPAPTPPATEAPLAVIRTTPLRGVSARVAALMLSGQQGGSIPIAAVALPVASTANGTTIAVVADVEGTNLLAGQEKRTVEVEVVAYAITAQGSVGGDLAEAFSLDLDTAADLLSRGGIKFFGSIEAPPGAYAVRVLVRNVQVGTFGITEVPRVTPAGDGTFAFLSPLLAAEPASAWVVARRPAADGGQDATGNPFPFLPASSLPSARPVLASGTAAVAWVLARGAAPGAPTMPVKVVGRDGTEVAAFDATVLERRGSGLAGAALVRLRLPVPALAPGPYLLELAAVPMTPDVRLASSIGVVVADPETVRAQPSWVLFGTPHPEAADATRQRTAFAGRPHRAKPSAKLAAEYRSALARIDAQPVAAVLEAVGGLERSSLATGSAAEWETLVASETQVAGELAAADPANLLALAWLHGQLYREYIRTKTYLGAAHARRMTEELAAYYGERGGKGAKPLAADVLAVLAGEIQQTGMEGTAERLFRRALDFDPGNPAALMGRAAGMERVGEYRLAATVLSRLLEGDAGNAEARLRLAVNLERLGVHGKSVELLEACAGEGNPRWVRVVAVQELAGGLIRRGRFEAAQRVLADGVAELPGDEALTIALAYVLDRLHRPLEARAVADRVGASPREDGDSPRYRYSQWPTDDLERARIAVADAGGKAVQTLRVALGKPPAEGGRP